jgi:hypothetical protein
MVTGGIICFPAITMGDLLSNPALDPEQTQLVFQLEQQANELQLTRNSARDRFEIAEYQSKQPNHLRWRKQLTAFSVAGFVGLVGTLYGWERRLLYWIPLSLGVGFGIGRVSVKIDDRRQTEEKQDWLAVCSHELQQADDSLAEVVTQYREAEETRWLMYAMELPKADLLNLQQWMADPRRTTKDTLLEAIDLVDTQFFQNPLDNTPGAVRSQERQLRQWRQQLLSQEFQVQKEHFMGTVISKHDLSRQQELSALSQQARTQRNLASSTGGVGVGLAVGAGFSALGSNLATVFGAADVAIGQTLSLGGMATAVGMGLVAATKIQKWMLQGEAERRQREAQKFQTLFQLSTQILETLLQAQENQTLMGKRQAISKALADLRQLKRQKIEDPTLKQSIQWLTENLTSYLRDLQAEQPHS